MRASGIMDESSRIMSARRTAAQPLHIQRLEASLDMGPFINYAQNVMLRPLTSSDDSDSEDGNIDLGVNGYSTSQSGKTFVLKWFVNTIWKMYIDLISERHSAQNLMYNFSQVGSDRKWLQGILMSDSDSEDEITDEDEYIRDMLKDHAREQKLRAKYYQNAKVCNIII